MDFPAPDGFSVERLFATPLASVILPDAEAINGELEAAILARRERTAGVINSNVGGWHSHTDFFDWGGEAAGEIARATIGLADAMTIDTAPVPGLRRGWTLEAWANVIDGTGSHVQHVHPNSYWSAVFYVRVDAGEGGEIDFMDPRWPAIEMHAPELHFRDAGGERTHRIAPVAGQLILFPSWLAHAVTPYRGVGRRITVALNLTAKPRPKAALTVKL